MVPRLKTDWLLFTTILLMVGFGIVMVYSASSVVAELNPKIKDSLHYATRQLVWAAVSFFVLMYFKKLDYHKLQSPAWAFGSVGIVLVLQILVSILDSKTHRWFRLEGVGTLQPSEFAKPALLIFLAWFVTSKQDTINSKRTMMAVCLPLAVLAATVGFGDLGTAIVLIVPAAIVFYVAGLAAQVRHCRDCSCAAVLGRVRGLQTLPAGAHHGILRSSIQDRFHGRS